MNGRIHGADTAGALPSSVRSVNKLKKKRGNPKLFNANGVLSMELTNNTKGRVEGHNKLQDNEIDLMNSILSTYYRADLNSKSKVTSADNIVLGQLDGIAFHNMPDGKVISIPNFPQAKNIQLAQLPQ
jgi:antitoxin component YwqK of YwqJK toxin-antitoxin module